jgi:hypothetical protein
MKVQLQIKTFRGGKAACRGFTPRTEHLPACARAANRTKVLPGEVFEVESREIAREYLDTGLLEVAL